VWREGGEGVQCVFRDIAALEEAWKLCEKMVTETRSGHQELCRGGACVQ